MTPEALRARALSLLTEPDDLRAPYAALYRGDAAPLAAEIGRGRFAPGTWASVSTLAGRPLGEVRTVCGEHRAGYDLWARTLVKTGGPPEELEDAPAVQAALLAALRAPLGVEPHRRSLLATLDALAAGWPAGTLNEAQNAIVILRHHTDLPNRWVAPGAGMRAYPFAKFPTDEPVPLSLNVARVAHLLPILRDPAAFRAHVIASLDHADYARRRLCAQLLAVEGEPEQIR